MNSLETLVLPPRIPSPGVHSALAAHQNGTPSSVPWPETAFVNPIATLTTVRQSATHGLGVFATVDIPCHTVWWRARPVDLIALTPAQYVAFVTSVSSLRTDPLIEAFLHFGYYIHQYDTLFFIPDNGRYVNHSFQPNSAVCPHSDGLCSVALRDIAVGEEICEDYTHYDKCPWARLYGEFGRQIGCWA